jgi:PilZ domain
MNTCACNEVSERPNLDSVLRSWTPIRPMTLESRNKPRYRCNLSLTLEGSGVTGWSCLHARSTDLSESGIAAVVECGLFPGDRAQIKLELPHSGEVLLLSAVIQNRSNSRYGFQFLSLSPRQISSLSDFCRMLEPLPADPQDRVRNMRESIEQTESRARLMQDQRCHIEVLKNMLNFTDGAARQYWTAEIEKLEAELKHL